MTCIVTIKFIPRSKLTPDGPREPFKPEPVVEILDWYESRIYLLNVSFDKCHAISGETNRSGAQ